MPNSRKAQQVIRPALLVSRILFLLANIWGFSDAVFGQNPTPQMRLEKALEDARSITNIEIQYDDVLWIKGKPGSPFTNDFTRTSHMTYIASNGKYREECRNESPQTNIVKFSEKAFDGKLWSGFSSGTRSMSQKDGDNPNDGENPLNPLIQPFAFLTRASDDCALCNLRFTDLRSSNILHGLILPNAQSSNRVFHLSFPGLILLGSTQLWSITLDDSGPDFKPKSITRTIYGGNRVPYNMEATSVFSQYTNVGDYWFPTKLAFRVVNVPTNKLLLPTLDSTSTMTLVSVKTPTQIPDSTFQLDESEARNIWNLRQFEGDGVGLILGEEGSNIVVKRIVADSPAGRQNELHEGDRISSISETNAAAVPVHSGKDDLPRASALLRGIKGSTVTLTFNSPGKGDMQTHTVTLVRGEVRSPLSDGRVLPDGTKAPDIEMVTLTNRGIEHLSDYAGKTVILEFWASWCLPCQKSMSELQLDAARYPGWRDKVVVITASVDDSAEIAGKHIVEKGWNQTHNVWLDPKGIEKYHVGGIPFGYIVNEEGIIIASGFAEEGFNISNIVNKQLSLAR